MDEERVGLVRRFQGGEVPAFEELFDLYGPDLARFAGHLTPDRALAEDLLQALWVKAWTHREALRDPSKFKSWLYRIAHRELLMQLRAGGRAAPAGPDPLDEPADELPSPPELLVREEDAAAVMERFHELPAFQKEVVWLSVVEGLAHGDIARILEIPEGTCRSRLFHALGALKEKLGNL